MDCLSMDFVTCAMNDQLEYPNEKLISSFTSTLTKTDPYEAVVLCLSLLTIIIFFLLCSKFYRY